ncbi:MAG TPA: OsmC family protein [Chloroflexota bacterium]|nr:OsmC family protein [Chloroflexota bacterium]
MSTNVTSLRVRATVEGQATVYARQHCFVVGAPLQFDGRYAQITALEYALGAVGADVVNGLRLRARKRRLRLDDVEAVVSGQLNNALTYLGVVGETGHPGLERLAVKVYVGSDASEEALRQLWDETLAASPLVRTFQSALDLDLTMKVLGS